MGRAWFLRRLLHLSPVRLPTRVPSDDHWRPAHPHLEALLRKLPNQGRCRHSPSPSRSKRPLARHPDSPPPTSRPSSTPTLSARRQNPVHLALLGARSIWRAEAWTKKEGVWESSLTCQLDGGRWVGCSGRVRQLPHFLPRLPLDLRLESHSLPSSLLPRSRSCRRRKRCGTFLARLRLGAALTRPPSRPPGRRSVRGGRTEVAVVRCLPPRIQR